MDENTTPDDATVDLEVIDPADATAPEDAPEAAPADAAPVVAPELHGMADY